jgi:hypothetical protein
MAPCVFETKFPYYTPFLFGTLMFTTGEDGTLVLLTQGLAQSHHESIYGDAPYYPAVPLATSTSGGASSGLNPWTGLSWFMTRFDSMGAHGCDEQ